MTGFDSGLAPSNREILTPCFCLSVDGSSSATDTRFGPSVFCSSVEAASGCKVGPVFCEGMVDVALGLDWRGVYMILILCYDSVDSLLWKSHRETPCETRSVQYVCNHTLDTHRVLFIYLLLFAVSILWICGCGYSYEYCLYLCHRKGCCVRYFMVDF